MIILDVFHDCQRVVGCDDKDHQQNVNRVVDRFVESQSDIDRRQKVENVVYLDEDCKKSLPPNELCQNSQKKVVVNTEKAS